MWHIVYWNSVLIQLLNSPLDDLLLQEDLVQIWPMINEANAMSEELNKKVKFEIALISPQARGKKHGRTEVSWQSRYREIIDVSLDQFANLWIYNSSL